MSYRIIGESGAILSESMSKSQAENLCAHGQKIIPDQAYAVCKNCNIQFRFPHCKSGKWEKCPYWEDKF
jgi:hypothetical protein